MAAATSSKPAALGDGQRFLLRSVGWGGYQSLLDQFTVWVREEIAKQGNRP
jgi:hypothetical protein